MKAAAVHAVLAAAGAFTLLPLLTCSGESRVAASTCKYEENCHCEVPGVTVRWKAAYCMYLNETDDLENAGVQRCVSVAEPPSLARLGACDQNTHWKEMICGALHKNEPRQIRRCLQDGEMIPRFVEKGEGADP